MFISRSREGVYKQHNSEEYIQLKPIHSSRFNWKLNEPKFYSIHLSNKSTFSACIFDLRNEEKKWIGRTDWRTCCVREKENNHQEPKAADGIQESSMASAQGSSPARRRAASPSLHPSTSCRRWKVEIWEGWGGKWSEDERVHTLLEWVVDWRSPGGEWAEGISRRPVALTSWTSPWSLRGSGTDPCGHVRCYHGLHRLGGGWSWIGREGEVARGGSGRRLTSSTSLFSPLLLYVCVYAYVLRCFLL